MKRDGMWQAMAKKEQWGIWRHQTIAYRTVVDIVHYLKHNHPLIRYSLVLVDMRCNFLQISLSMLQIPMVTRLFVRVFVYL